MVSISMFSWEHDLGKTNQPNTPSAIIMVQWTTVLERVYLILILLEIYWDTPIFQRPHDDGRIGSQPTKQLVKLWKLNQALHYPRHPKYRNWEILLGIFWGSKFLLSRRGRVSIGLSHRAHHCLKCGILAQRNQPTEAHDISTNLRSERFHRKGLWSHHRRTVATQAGRRMQVAYG